MTTKDYNAIKLKNSCTNAVNQALAKMVINNIENKINAYQTGTMTASEFLNYVNNIAIINNNMEVI